MQDRRLAVALFVLALGPYVYFYGGWGANQEANHALTRAIVEAKRLSIDEFTVREGDITEGRGGRIYSNKAPGLSLLGAAPYFFLYEAQQRGITKFRDPWLTNKQIVTVVVCGVGGALVAPILFLHLRRLNVRRLDASMVCIAIAFGTIVFPYSTMLFAHVPAALFLLIAFVVLRGRPLLAGIAAGVSGLCFPVSAVAAVVLALFLAVRESTRKAAWFVAGGVPFAVGLAVYQWACFGSPFTTPVENSREFTEQGRIFGVFAAPKLAPLAGITVSEYRGLFFYSPVLLLAFAGAVIMIKRRQHRGELLAAGLVAAVFVLANISFNGWHGGAAFGPRYLVPIVPLLAIPMAFAAGGRLRGVFLVLGAISIATNLLATAVDAMPIDGYDKPFTGYIVPSFLAKPISPESRAIEYPDCRTPRCETREVALAQDSMNFGEAWLGRGRRASILPGMLWIAIGSAIALVAAARLDRGDGQRPNCLRRNAPA